MSERILVNAGQSPRGWSKRSTWLRCAHKYALERAGYVGDDRDALLRGSLFHVGMAHHYAREQALQLDRDPDDYYTSIDAMELYVRLNPECDPFLEACTEAIEEYADVYAMEDYRILGVEHLVEMSIVGPLTEKTYRHTMRLDLILQDRAGRVWIVDHKTSGQRVDKRKRQGFELSGQVIGASWWARKEYGLDFAGFMINFVGITAKGRQFERFHPRLAPYAQSMFPLTIEHSEEYLLWCQARYGDNPDDWPPMLQEQGPCMDRYGPCEFRSMCRWGSGITGRDREDD